MSEAEQGFVPADDSVGHAGCRVDMSRAAALLNQASARRIEVLRATDLPRPVTRVSLSLVAGVRDGQPTHLFDAEVRVGGDRMSPERVRSLVLGNDPLGVLLARRVEAGDAWAVRIVDGVGTATATAYRRLRLERTPAGPAGPSVLHDEATGLRVAVRYERVAARGAHEPATTVMLHAAVPSTVVSPSHLGAMVRLVLGVVVEQLDGPSDGQPLAGRHYVLDSADGVRPAAASAPATAEVTLDQVGGLGDVVAELRQIAVSFRHPQAMARWGARRPQGILMYGPPGTGKTMLSRALANEIGASFREIRTPEILDKWLGGSERNIKRIFREARRYREPTVMLFDEFDTIISYAGAGGDAASQAINAVAGIFKQEMNNLIEENPDVIVVATTNFPHRVDESLVRSGRFDVKIAIGLPDETGRAEIFRKMIGQLAATHDRPGFRMFADDVDVAGLAAATPSMTGADVREVLRRVQLAKAMQDARTGGPVPPIGQVDLLDSIAALADERIGRR